MISSGAPIDGHVSTGTSRPSVRNPTAMCATGEIRITTGGSDDDWSATSAIIESSQI
jgi:hypothetical protein